MFFHAKYEIFKGGFIGVDVFFVISGYLITSIIYKEKLNGNFSLIHFYERRIRRIFPMIFFLLSVVAFFSFILYSPTELKNIFQSIVSTVTYTSNIYFYNKTGYFEINLENHPLIHTWSLAVEEQFYIIFPLIFLITYKFGQNIKQIVFFILALLSFLSIYLFVSHSEFNFFIVSSRMWELLAGSLVAINKNSFYKKEIVKKNYKDFFSIIGILGVIISSMFLDSNSFHPGPVTIVPILSTVLIIKYMDQETILGKILSSKPFVKLGLLSYSAYLIHQPLFVYVSDLMSSNMSDLIYMFLIILTFYISYYTYIFIETPFRNKNIYSRKRIFINAFSFSVFFIVIGIYGHFSGGIPERFSAEQNNILNRVEISPLRNECHTEGVNFLNQVKLVQ